MAKKTPGMRMVQLRDKIQQCIMSDPTEEKVLRRGGPRLASFCTVNTVLRPRKMTASLHSRTLHQLYAHPEDSKLPPMQLSSFLEEFHT